MIYCKIDDICEKKIDIVKGKDDYLIDYIDISSIDNKKKRITSFNTISLEEAPSRAKQILKKGDILVSTVRPNLNAVAVCDIESNNVIVGSTGYCVLRCKKNVDSRYIFHYCKSKQFISGLEHVATGASYPAVKNSDVKNSLIPMFELETQKKISRLLDKAQSIIDKRKEQIDILDELVKSKFMEMFGNNGETVDLIDYIWFQEGPGVRSMDFTEEGTILLTGSNINDNKITFGYKSDRYISNELSNGKYNHFMCDKDDILVVSSAIAPDKFDKKVVVVKEDKKYCLNTGIIRFKPDLNYLTIDYFTEFLKTDFFKYQVIKEMRGIAQMHFGPSHLKTMKILLPDSIELQNEFAEFVKRVEKLKSKMENSLKELDDNFNSLRQKAFKGELFND